MTILDEIRARAGEQMLLPIAQDASLKCYPTTQIDSKNSKIRLNIDLSLETFNWPQKESAT